jgi:hypothetical protein
MTRRPSPLMMRPRFFLETARRLLTLGVPARPLRSSPTLALVHLRALHPTCPVLDMPSWPNHSVSRPPVVPSDKIKLHSVSSNTEPNVGFHTLWRQWSQRPSLQAALTTVVGLGIVFGAGVGYLRWYKGHVLRRVSGNVHSRRCFTGRRLLMGCSDTTGFRARLCELKDHFALPLPQTMVRTRLWSSRA